MTAGPDDCPLCRRPRVSDEQVRIPQPPSHVLCCWKHGGAECTLTQQRNHLASALRSVLGDIDKREAMDSLRQQRIRTAWAILEALEC